MPIPKTTPRLERSLAREDAYDLLRTWIVEGDLAPGERIQDSSLATTLGVSRMPVREALLRLQSEGLIQTAPNRWIRVAPVSPLQGEDIYPILWTLERLAVSQGAAAITASDLDRMVDANERLRSAISAGNGPKAFEADTAFHATFITCAQNSELERVLADLKQRLRRLEVAYFSGNLKATSSVEEHARIIDAMRSGNMTAAGDAVEDNWRRSLERFRAQASDPSVIGRNTTDTQTRSSRSHAATLTELSASRRHP